jgi:hypothetical protein
VTEWDLELAGAIEKMVSAKAPTHARR